MGALPLGNMLERLSGRILVDPKKFGAIVERPDLFETKFLQITPSTQVADRHKFFLRLEILVVQLL